MYIIGLISVLSLLISLFLFVYAIEHIYHERAEQQRLLDEWEAIADGEYADPTVDQLIVAAPTVQVSMTDETKVDSSTITNVQENNAVTTKVIGKLSIPDLKGKWPIVAGTGMRELAQGMGHYTGSAELGKQGNAILAGHREMGLLKLDKLEVGAEIIVETKEGKFIYHVSEKKIVEQNDRSVHIESDEAVLTLITCYPLTYTGPAEERYIVAATMVP